MTSEQFEKDTNTLVKSIIKTATVDLTCRVLVEDLTPSFAANIAKKLNKEKSAWRCIIVTNEAEQMPTLMSERSNATVERKVVYLYTATAIKAWAKVNPSISGVSQWVKVTKALLTRINKFESQSHEPHITMPSKGRAIFVGTRDGKPCYLWIDVKQAHYHPDMEFFTTAKKVHGSRMRCIRNGAAVDLLRGMDDKKYVLYMGDYSIREANRMDVEAFTEAMTAKA